MEHSIGLSHVGSARELGGYAVGGKTVRSGLLLRTADLAEAAAEDLERLEKTYHVAAVVDFRMSVERALRADPALPGAENHPLPVMEPADFEGFDDEAMAAFLDPNGDRLAMMKQSVELGLLSNTLYADFLRSERGKAAYRAFFRLLLDLPENRAILWHCTDGKDRTGLAAMLLLTALGASWETVMEDYLLTNVWNEKKLAAARAWVEHSALEPELREMVLFGVGGVAEIYMNNARKALEEDYGSVEGYLAQALGVGEDERAILRGKFLGSAD